jgi:predicted NBD/HSP70 family sugar kinase
VWVDNDVNLMVLGEYMHGPDVDENMLFVKVGSGIGAGILVRGELLRGAKGAAGDIGHVESADSTLTCRCGQVGCLETVAAGWALARDAAAELERGAESPMLSSRLAHEGRLIGEDVARSAAMGDPLALRLIERSARTVGETLASVINILNPAVVVVGGSIGRTGDRFLAPVRESIYRRSLPLATRDLRIVPASLGHEQGLIGGASLVSSRLLALGSLERWGTRGTPLSMDRKLLYATAGY